MLLSFAEKDTLTQILPSLLNVKRKFTVTCGYRCPKHNAEVGGVPNSQHTLGTACDIYCNNLSVDELAELARVAGFDGIGRYYKQEFVHVDVRSNGCEPAVYQWTD